MKTPSSLMLPIAILLFAISVVGCSKVEKEETVGTKIDTAIEKSTDKIAKESKKVDLYLDDSAITANVKMAVLDEKSLTSSDISVETVNGVTSLTGSVGSKSEKETATEVVSKVNGVKNVINELEVTAK